MFGGFIGATNIKPGTVSFTLAAQFNYSTTYPFGDLRIDPAQKSRAIAVTDDGNGNLIFEDDVHGRTAIGTIEYATGQINVSASTALGKADVQGPAIITTPLNFPQYSQTFMERLSHRRLGRWRRSPYSHAHRRPANGDDRLHRLCGVDQ